MIFGIELPTAIDVSSVVGLTALGLFTAQILMGLLLSVGYNPIRQWPRQRWIKLFTFHNWLGYIGLATALTHPLILLVSSQAGFRLFDVLVPIWSPTQPIPSTLGAIALYLIAFVVLTSYFRRLFGRHRWKQLHYTAYAAAAVFYVHGVWADPLLKNRPVDWIDAEKVYVEGCALLVIAATTWRFNYGRRTARFGRGRLAP
ncbi:MAG: ferric reductase-like transmembrane domain-containing protein [Vicinamibacterales bacterium]